MCGSAARGDFIDGWSDIDFIGWGLPADSPAAEHLAELVATSTHDHAVRVSLHLAGHQGRDAPRVSRLHDMKMRAVLARVGVDAPLIAGVNPSTPFTAAVPEHGLQLLHEFAVEQLRKPAASERERKDVARRTLSVLCSATRIVAMMWDTQAGLRIPEIVTAFATRQPGTQVERLLHEYDLFRRAGASDLNTAETLATQVPDALTALRRVLLENERR